jgi:hypothetical protein
MNLENRNAITEDIVVYENFLTPQESANLIKVLDKQAENGGIQWTPISFYESYSSILPKDGDPELEEFNLPSTFLSDVKAKIIEAVASIKGLDPKVIVEIGYHTQKWEPGAYARKHSDNTDEHGNTGPFARSRYAAFIYLNDDFDGGLLRFPDQNVEIQPKVGSLAVFDGGHKNMHEVTMITKGVRYTIGSFWDDRAESSYPQEVRDAWAEEMKKIRESQKVEKEEWQEILKDGYKIDPDGKKYKIEELLDNE